MIVATLLAVLANTAITVRNPRLGVLVYAGLSMLLPHPSIAGAAVPYEMLGLPAVFASAALVRRAVRHPHFHLLVATYLALVLLSTVIGVTSYGSALDGIRILGFLRALVVLSLFRETLDGQSIEGLLLLVLTIEAVVGFAQLLVPGGASLFFHLYGTEGGTVLQRYAEMGSIPRASGTFSSPVILGSVALVAVAIAASRLIAGEGQRRHRWLLVSAALAGMLSLTKTFILGVPVLLAGGFALRLVGGPGSLRFRPRRLLYALGLVLTVVGLSAWTAGYLSDLGLPVEYYLGFLFDPTAAFARRYGPGGLLAETLSVIDENFLVGVGLTNVRGESLGDSLYVIILHSTGLVGAVLVTGIVLLISWRFVAARHPFGLLVLAAFLLTGAAANLAFKLPGALVLAYLTAVSEPVPVKGVRAPTPSWRARRGRAPVANPRSGSGWAAAPWPR